MSTNYIKQIDALADKMGTPDVSGNWGRHDALIGEWKEFMQVIHDVTEWKYGIGQKVQPHSYCDFMSGIIVKRKIGDIKIVHHVGLRRDIFEISQLYYVIKDSETAEWIEEEDLDPLEEN